MSSFNLYSIGKGEVICRMMINEYKMSGTQAKSRRVLCSEKGKAP